MTSVHTQPNLHFYTLLFEQMQTALLCTDENLTILYVNNAGEMLLNHSKNQLLQTNLDLFFEESLTVPNLVTRAIAQNQAFFLTDTKILNKPNVATNNNYSLEKNVVDIAVTPIKQQNGFMLLFELIQKGQQASIALLAQQRQQQEITRTLIRSVAHEIKNPLASIRGAAQLMQMTTQDLALNKEKHQELFDYTDVMIKESDRIKKLADDMLGSNKLLSKSPINIHQCLEHVSTLVKSQFPSIAIKRDYDSSLPEVSLDHDRFIQVFLNISLNAAQAMTELLDKENNQQPDFKPCITLKTRVAFHKVLMDVNYRHCLQVSIIDNGKGIPKHIQETLFYPLVSARKNGTGLGLSIAQEITRQHGGRIDFESEFGKTCFDIFIPFEQQVKAT